MHLFPFLLDQQESSSSLVLVNICCPRVNGDFHLYYVQVQPQPLP